MKHEFWSWRSLIFPFPSVTMSSCNYRLHCSGLPSSAARDLCNRRIIDSWPEWMTSYTSCRHRLVRKATLIVFFFKKTSIPRARPQVCQGNCRSSLLNYYPYVTWRKTWSQLILDTNLICLAFGTGQQPQNDSVFN